MKKIILLIIGLIVFHFMSWAQLSRTEQEAYYLSGFAKFLHWNDKSNKFLVNIVGSSSVLDNLNELAKNHTFNGKTLLARVTDSANLYKCHILFINKNYGYMINKVMAEAPSSAVVVAEDNPQADINFYYKKISKNDSNIVYSVNLQSLKKKKVTYSYQFIGLADKIIQ